MYKKAKDLKVGDMWINSVGCLFRIESVERIILSDGDWVEIRHPGGSGHVLKSDRVIEYI